MNKNILLILIIVISTFAFAKFIWPPYLTNQGETYATINFKTLDENIQVKLYEENVLIKKYDKIKNGLVHLKLEKLRPNTKYTYEIITNDDYYKGYFNTKNDDKKRLRFIVYGDTRYYDKLHRMIIEKIIKENPEFVFNVGDMVENGNEIRYWNNFFNVIKGLNAFYYPVLGNHERNSKIYYEAFDLPVGGGEYNKRWYSFSYKNAHFVVLDSIISISSDLFEKQTKWLIKDLENNKDKNIIVFYHYPFWNNSAQVWRKQNTKLEEKWRPIFEKYNVKLVFNGHVHGYERFEKNGIVYITTGGGGAPFDKGTRKEFVPNTKKVVYGTLEYVIVEINDKSIKIIVKAVGESKNYSMYNVKPIDKLIDFIELK
ncbi:Calcineurin-like phosphoesterase [Marinitoga hydrogenitolerans DSM 16785]|uniref:Calcineurin-like phosphoesterase n=1 Tax=Marinitoga hydrogenitolerans (strain DSM 16785 / JCM 12826 / AT1271) TaxID=1122195 RepID=A0A1M4VFX0_MARH1|nr:metallophosphoesterase [Marinitoga hydrogenitolerans]SHE67916.1 Calcineurin-like phosphoesterase [Marinitoga hydrogenitolerans DSM 16785]